MNASKYPARLHKLADHIEAMPMVTTAGELAHSIGERV